MVTPVKKLRHLVVGSPVKKRLRTKLNCSPICRMKRMVIVSSDTEEIEETKPNKGNTRNQPMKNDDVVLVTSGSETDFTTDSDDVEPNNIPDGRVGSSSDTVAQKKPTVLYRSNLNSAMKELGELRFLPQHLQLMRITPFYPLFESLSAPKDVSKLHMCKKKDVCIQKIINSYSAVHDAFMLGDKVKLTEVDFSLILGVCEGSRDVERRLKKGFLPKWVLRCFRSEIAAMKANGGSFSMERSLIYRKLVSLIASSKPTDIEDVVRLINCYILAAVLMTKQNGNMRNDLAQMFEKLDEISLYDWSGLFINFLITQIKAKTKMVGGCAVILPYFVLEHTKLLDPTFPGLYPRYLQWDMAMGNLELAQTKIKNLKGVRTKIVPTAAERSAMALVASYREEFKGKAKLDEGMIADRMTFPAVVTNHPVDVKREAEGVRENMEVTTKQESLGTNDVNVGCGVYSSENVAFGGVGRGNHVRRLSLGDADDGKGVEVEVVPDSDVEYEDDVLVNSTYDMESSPIYNNPFVVEVSHTEVRDGADKNDVGAGTDHDVCPGLSHKMRLVDLNDPVFVTPRQINTDRLERGAIGDAPESGPLFDRDRGPAVDPPPMTVNLSQVERYMGETSLVDHLEAVTRDNSRLIGENLKLQSHVEILSQTIVDRDTQVVALNSIVAANRDMVDEEVRILRAENAMLHRRAEEIVEAKDRHVMQMKAGQEALSTLRVENDYLRLQLKGLRADNERLVANAGVDREAAMNMSAAFDVLHVQLKDFGFARESVFANLRVEREAMSAEFATTLEENALKAERRLEEKDEIITKKNVLVESLERTLVLKDTEITSLKDKIQSLEGRVAQGEMEIETVRGQLLTYTEPTYTQFFDNPIVQELSDKVAELHEVSSKKLELEKGKVGSETILSAQKDLIDKLANITNGLQETVTPLIKLSSSSPVYGQPPHTADGPVLGTVTPISRFSTVGPVCEGVLPIRMGPYPKIIYIDEDDNVADVVACKSVVKPSSLAKRVKDRTTDNERAAKNLSPFAVYGDGVAGLRGGAPRTAKKEPFTDVSRPALVFEEKFLAISKTPGATRKALLEAWDINGPDTIIYRGEVPMAEVKLKDMMRVLMHERVCISIINAYPDLVSRELCRRGRGSKTFIFTARFMGFLRAKASANRQKFFTEFFMKFMPMIVDAEILLFPVNPYFGNPEPSGRPDDWMLLKYVRVSSEWHIFNPKQSELGCKVDACRDDLQFLIGYVESSMQSHLEKTGGTHPVQKRKEPGTPILKKCPQAVPGKPESAAVVLSVMEKCIKRDNNLPIQFTEEMSARFRSKLAQCLTFNGDRVPI